MLTGLSEVTKVGKMELADTHMYAEHFLLVASVSLEPGDQVWFCNRLQSFNLKPTGMTLSSTVVIQVLLNIKTVSLQTISH